MLKFKELVFLLFLRDPTIKQLVSLESLIQYFFESTKIASDLSEYFFQSKGKGLVFIFDGYDEMSEEDRNNSLVAKIISRNILPDCDLVITSRPSASLYLRDVADCRVEVLGFTEEDRLDYIQHALKGIDDKIEALQFYLQSNSTINALCYVPLNMTILLCLFEEVECISHSALNLDNKEDIGLPNTQTEMYEKFILMTITRFIKKSDKTFSGKCLTFSDLPEPYYKAFDELLCLAYCALTKDQIVFSYNDEVIQACPILKSGNWEGLGLLKVTEYVNNVSFHFLHFSIQEYLAAYHIALQSSNFQVQLLKDTFWDIHYFNTWIMYVGMTGGKKMAWKHFISGNRFMISTKVFKSSKISKRYLNDKIKSLHLFQCVAEIGNKKLAGKVFNDKIIDLSNQTLLPRDINTICFFLLRSVNKYWIKLDLSNCNIGDIGGDIFCKTFLDKSRDIVSIDEVDLSYNQLQSHSILGLLDVFKVWDASEVVIYGSQDNDSRLFESCLNKFSLHDDENFSQTVLIGPYIFANNVDVHNQIINSPNITTGLYLNHCNYPSTDFKYEKLSDKLKLTKLHVIGENIKCYFIVTLVQTINKEVATGSVYIYDHTLSDDGVNYISIMLSKIYSDKLGVWVVIGRTKIQGNIPDMVTLNQQFSPIEICNLGDSIKRLCFSSTMSTAKFNKYIRFESKSVFEDFFYLLHEMNSKCEIDFCLSENNLLITNRVEYGRFHKIISSNKNLTSIFITKCKLNTAEFVLIGEQKSLERLYICDSFLDIHSFEYEHLLNQTLRLKELFIHSTDPTYTLTFDLLEAKKYYRNISVLLIADNTLIGHNPTCEQILLSSKLKANFTVWRINNFPLNIELFQKIANTLSNVMDLNIIGCDLEENELQQCNSCDEQHSDYRIIKKPVDNIGEVLSYFTKLKTLSLCHNDLQEAVVGKIFKYISLSNLSKLNISHNEIDDEAVDDTAKLLTQIIKLEGLDLSCNNLQGTEIVTLLSAVQNTSSCTTLNISYNNIDDKAAHNIATFLSHNTQLKELDLNHSNLQTMDAITVCKGMSSLLHLTKLNISNNNITGAAAADIAIVLSQNILIEELNLSYNNFGMFGSLHILRNMKNLSTLIKLNVCSIGLTNIAAVDIANVLNNNNKLQELDLSHNDIEATGATTIFKKASISSLSTLIISHNNISDNVDFLAAFLSRNINLEEIDFSHNNLQSAGAIKVCSTNLSNLIKFNISHNGITIDAVDDIGTLIFRNDKLQKIDLSGNDLQELGHQNAFKSLLVVSNLKYLQKLDFSHNNLSTLDTIKFFGGMKDISNLVTINASHNVITDVITAEAAQELAVVLSHNIRLKDVNFSYCNLSTSATEIILKGMKDISSLRTLDISHNMITDKAAESVATVLSHNNKLQSLDLSYNYFTSEGFVKIFEHTKNIVYLRKLNISHNEITIKAAHRIATFLSLNSKLEELDLSNTILQTPGAIIIFKSLRQFSNLRKLFFNDNMITDEAADDIAVVLSQSTKLEELDVSCNNLQTAGIIKIFGSIKRISTLTKLDIAHSMVTDEAMEYILDGLYSNNKLKELNLSHINLENAINLNNIKLTNLHKFMSSNNSIQFTSEFSHFLSHCTNLRVLDLSFTNLQGMDVEVFNGLDIFSLTKFDISGNSIPTYAADNIAILLSKNDELEELNLSCNKLKELGVRNILDSINVSNLTSLNISNNQITRLKYIADILTYATKIVELDLSYNKLSAEDMKRFLYRTKNIFTNLVKLNVSGNIISDEVASAFANVLLENKKLKELDLSDNNLHTEGIRKIFNGLKISTLIKLRVGHNSITDQEADHMVTFLSRNKSLEELDLSHNNLRSAGAIKICRIYLPRLAVFNISHNYIATKAATDIATFLSSMKLKKLDLSHNHLSSDGIIVLCRIANISKLTAINLSHNGIRVEAKDDIAAFLSRNTKLQDLDLSCSELEESGCLIIFKVLQNTSVLASLKISNCNVINEAADELATVLLCNTLLQELDLSYNNLSKSDSVTILKGMKNISNLIVLNVSQNTITDEAAEELGTVLHHNPLLQVLNLSYDNLSTSDAMKIFKGIQIILNLVTINIGHNMITDEAVDDLVCLLFCNTSLKEIDLSSNHISASSAIKIFKGMEKFSNLEAINISHNMITDEVAEVIATVLSHNNKLKSLDLSSNYFTSEGFVKIFDGMKNIVYLKNLSIGSNEITASKAIDCITTILSHNLELEELDLANSFIQTAGVVKIFKSLRNISNLKKICIRGNIITNEAADDIAVVLSQNTKLEEIDIACNNLHTTNAVKIFQGMMHISTLTKLDIAHNMITNEATEYIVSILSNNNKLKQLNLSHNNIVISDLVNCNFTNLQELDLSYTNLQTVLNIKDLKVVTLQKCNISGHCIPARKVIGIAGFLFENDELQELDLSCNNLQGIGIRSILDFLNISNLTKLNISNNSITSDLPSIINALVHATKLVQLNLSCNALNSDNMEYILCKAKSVFINLKNLNLSGNEICNGAATALANVFSGSSKLKELSLCDTNLQTEEMNKIFGTLRFPYLTKLSISHNNITHETADGIATFLSKSRGLEELDLSYNNLKSAGITKICRMNLQKLNTFNVSHNGITTKAANAIATFLSHNLELQALDISCNDLLEAGCRNIFTALKSIMTLSALKLTNCHVINEAADELANILFHNSLLHELDLSYSNLSASDVVKIFNGMQNSSHLVTLNISHNMITDEAAEIIATVLSHNNKLQSLDLSYNYFTSEGFVKVFEHLKNIIYLRKLNISHNEITIKAAHSIATFLSLNSKLEELDLSNNILQTPGAIIIFRSLRHFSNLKKLYINGIMNTDEAADDIEAVLSQNTELEELDIGCNNLQAFGAMIICNTNLMNLTTFNISHNGITTVAAESIAAFLSRNKKLEKVDISYNHLSYAIKVTASLTNLTALNISHNAITSPDDLAIILSKNNDLQELVMSFNNLEAGGIDTILCAVKSSNLTKLNISANNAKLVAVVNVLLQHTNLVELDLSYNWLHNAVDVIWFFSVFKDIFINLIKLNIAGILCDISDEAATDLAYIFSQSNKLNELDLSDNNLNPEAASKILNGLNTSTLIKLRISHNNITDEVACDIANFLCKCTNLEELDLSYNSLQDSGATKISRANISSLVSFNISHNNITIKAADDVANFLSCNSQMQKFDLSCNGLLEVGVRNILKDMQVVQSIFNSSVLNIGEGSVINETVSELITILLCNTGLKEFDLSCNSLFISDAVNILQGMKNVSNLVTINLSHTYITDEAADELATVLLHNTSLQNIDLSYNDLSTSDAIKILKGMKNISRLEAINICHNMITCEAADELATVLSHNNGLEIFNMSSNCFSSDGCIKIMNGMSNTLYLKKIDISCNQITFKAADSITTFLSHSSKLEELILSCNDFQKSYLFEKIRSEKLTKFNVSFAHLEVDDIANVLMHNTELEDLNFSNNELWSDDIVRICLTMKNISNLKRIDVSHNRITCEAADDIANILSQNTNLQELYLSNNYLQSHGIVTLFKMSTVSNLTHLDISSNKITDEAADEIADFLLLNSNLKVLDLSNNLIQAAGATIIFGKSNTNYNLKKLNLSLNAVDDEAADTVASFLSQNPSLEEFDLSKNCLQAVGAVKIFKAIRNCPNICKVNMSNNWISDEAGDEITHVLSTVTKLREIDLDCNLLSAEMSDYIKKAFIILP